MANGWNAFTKNITCTKKPNKHIRWPAYLNLFSIKITLKLHQLNIDQLTVWRPLHHIRKPVKTSIGQREKSAMQLPQKSAKTIREYFFGEVRPLPACNQLYFYTLQSVHHIQATIQAYFIIQSADYTAVPPFHHLPVPTEWGPLLPSCQLYILGTVWVYPVPKPFKSYIIFLFL